MKCTVQYSMYIVSRWKPTRGIATGGRMNYSPPEQDEQTVIDHRPPRPAGFFLRGTRRGKKKFLIACVCVSPPDMNY